MIDSTQQQFLHAVFCLSRASRPITFESIASRAGLSITQAAMALISLDRSGFMDADHMRLTMSGLAVATNLDAMKRTRRRRRIRALAFARLQTLLQPMLRAMLREQTH